MNKKMLPLLLLSILSGLYLSCDLAAENNDPGTNLTTDPVYITGSISGNYSGNVSFNVWYNNQFLWSGPLVDGTNMSIDISSVPIGQVLEFYVTPDRNANALWEEGEGWFFLGLLTNDGQNIDIGNLELNLSNYLITVDDVANKNSQVYMFATIDTTNQGWYASSMYGDPVDRAYALFDDGTHGDVTAGDFIWSLELSLITGLDDYQFRFKDTSSSGDYQGGFLLYSTTNTDTLAYSMPLTYLTQDTVVLFQVDASAESFSSISLRGSLAPLAWLTGTGLFDDGTQGDAISSDGIWSKCVTFPSGSLTLFEYKYVLNGTVWERELLGNRIGTLDPSQITNVFDVVVFDE